MAEPDDLNLDELKRRGRRRLIGAIVLALVAAVVVPMLLENEPKPLGEDVSVRIPPVDEGKFVSKLRENRPKAESAKVAPAATTSAATTPAATTPAATTPAAAPPAAPAAAPEAEPAAKEATPAAPALPVQETPPRKSIADAEKAVLSPAARAAPAPPKSNGGGAKPPVAAKEADAVAAKAPTAAEATPKPSEADARAPQGGFAVQLAAFSDDKGANALANKLKRAGYPAFTETVATSQKTLWRVRVGPYPSREAAAQSRDKLKAEGHPGIVVAAR